MTTNYTFDINGKTVRANIDKEHYKFVKDNSDIIITVNGYRPNSRPVVDVAHNKIYASKLDFCYSILRELYEDMELYGEDYQICAQFATRISEMLEQGTPDLFVDNTICTKYDALYEEVNEVLEDCKVYYLNKMSIEDLERISLNIRGDAHKDDYNEDEEEEVACAFQYHDDSIGEDILTTARVDKEHYELLHSNIPIIGTFTRRSNPLYEYTDPSNPKIYGSCTDLLRDSLQMSYIPTALKQYLLDNMRYKLERGLPLQFESSRVRIWEHACKITQLNAILRNRKFTYLDAVPIEELEANEKNRVEALTTKKLEAYENIFAQFLPLVTQMSEALANMGKQLEELKK